MFVAVASAGTYEKKSHAKRMVGVIPAGMGGGLVVDGDVMVIGIYRLKRRAAPNTMMLLSDVANGRMDGWLLSRIRIERLLAGEACCVHRPWQLRQRL